MTTQTLTHPLSRREIEVLQLLEKYTTQKLVAREIGISPESVKDHAKAARLKLGARNTTQAVAKAIRAGLM